MRDDDKWELRNQLIERARRGELTGEQANAEAIRQGLGPLLTRADPEQFDPMAEPHWDIPMALGWLMTRDTVAVRAVWERWRNSNEFWSWREERTPAGTTAGHWIARQGPVGLLDLTLLQGQWEREGKLLLSRADAEARLMNDLASGWAFAFGIPSRGGMRVEIPSHEWRDLRLFEESKRIVARTDKGFGPGYDNVIVHRERFLSLTQSDESCQAEKGVRHPAACQENEASPEAWPIEAAMLQPISAPGMAGYVPLCSALHWIMTQGGTLSRMMDDTVAWNNAVGALWPLVCGGEMELIGLGRAQTLTQSIPPQSLALVRLISPGTASIDDLLSSAPSHVSCINYVDEEHWRGDYNDKLNEHGRRGAAWTHLQLRKADVLSRWPRPDAVNKSEAELTALGLGRVGAKKKGAKTEAVLEAVAALWVGDVPTGLSAKERNEKIRRWIKENELSVPDPRTIQRVLTGR